jgi:hypothetical protein
MPRDYDLTAKAMIAGAEKAISDVVAPLLQRIDTLERQKVGRDVALEAIRTEAARGEEVRTAEHRAVMAEHREALSELRLKIEAKLLEVRDGKDGVDGKDGTNGTDGRDGTDADMDAVMKRLEELVAQIPVPQDGKDGRDGVDGKDAYPGEARGLYDPEATYRALDVVSLNGSEWRAKCDNPGPLPGDDWMLSAQRGKRGEPGPIGKGTEGKSGRNGAQLVGLGFDADKMELFGIMDDGNQLEADFGPIAHKIIEALREQL